MHDIDLPEIESGRFALIIVCDNRACGEASSVCGDWSHEHIVEYDHSVPIRTVSGWILRLEPDFWKPAPHIISIPEACPNPVRECAIAAFSLFWCDRPSAANRLRTLLETLLSEQGVKCKRRVTEGSSIKIRRMSLHERIEHYKQLEPIIADHMLAIKWIGNEGSHDGHLSKDDLLDAFQIIEHVLDDVYTKRRKNTQQIVEKVNKKRGPRSRGGKN